MLSWNTLAQAGGVYQWTDAQGRAHFDDSNVLEQQLTIEVINGHRIPPQPGSEAAQAADAARQRCNTLSERLNNYRSARQLEGRDPDGHAYLMSARQVQIEIATTERDQRRACAPVVAGSPSASAAVRAETGTKRP